MRYQQVEIEESDLEKRGIHTNTHPQQGQDGKDLWKGDECCSGTIVKKECFYLYGSVIQPTSINSKANNGDQRGLYIEGELRPQDA